MTSNTDTLPPKTSTTTGEAHRPHKARHGTLVWAAVIGACIAVVALAVATLTGSDDSDIPTTRLDPQAEQYERQAHLDGQATTHGRGSGAATPSEADDQSARHAEAEQYERQAHLDGQARTYGRHPADTPAPTDEADTPEPEFLPGSRRVPTR